MCACVHVEALVGWSTSATCIRASIYFGCNRDLQPLGNTHGGSPNTLPTQAVSQQVIQGMEPPKVCLCLTLAKNGWGTWHHVSLGPALPSAWHLSAHPSPDSEVEKWGQAEAQGCPQPRTPLTLPPQGELPLGAVHIDLEKEEKQVHSFLIKGGPSPAWGGGGTSLVAPQLFGVPCGMPCLPGASQCLFGRPSHQYHPCGVCQL